MSAFFVAEIDSDVTYCCTGAVLLQIACGMMHAIDRSGMAESRSGPPRIPATILARRRVPPESQQGGIRPGVSDQEVSPTGQLGDGLLEQNQRRKCAQSPNR